MARLWTLLITPRVLLGQWQHVRRPYARAAGIAVCVDEYFAPPGSTTHKITEALELIGRADPARLARLQHDVPRIFVGEMAFGGTHWVWPRAIALRAKHVLDHPAIGVASTIAHEGTHVRIRRKGIRTTDANRARIERRCVREQIHCLRQIAAEFPELAEDAEYYIAHKERDLLSPTPWYEPSRKWARIRELLVEYGASRRVLWLFDALRPDSVAEAPAGTEA